MYQPGGGGGCGCFGLLFFGILLPIIALLVLAVAGPAVGSVFSNVTMAL